MLNAAVGTEAAVNGNYYTGNEFGPVRQQIQQGSREFLRCPVTLHGRAVHDFLSARRGCSCFFIYQQKAVLVGEQKAGSNGVDANAGVGKVHGQPLGKLLMAALDAE